MVKKIVRGNFRFAGENHGRQGRACCHRKTLRLLRQRRRPYYQKDEKFNDLDALRRVSAGSPSQVLPTTSSRQSWQVMLYFWDDRDGSDFAGWWFGPKVGGDQADPSGVSFRLQATMVTVEGLGLSTQRKPDTTGERMEGAAGGSLEPDRPLDCLLRRRCRTMDLWTRLSPSLPKKRKRRKKQRKERKARRLKEGSKSRPWLREAVA